MKFTELVDFKLLGKKEIAKTLKNPRYSGKTLKDKDGKIERGPGFYHE